MSIEGEPKNGVEQEEVPPRQEYISSVRSDILAGMVVKSYDHPTHAGVEEISSTLASMGEDMQAQVEQHRSGFLGSLDQLRRSSDGIFGLVSERLTQEKYRKHMGDTELAEAEAAARLVHGRGIAISRNITDYIIAVAAMHRVAGNELTLGARYEKMIKTADERRIRAHNQLIKSIEIFHDEAKKLIEFGLLEEEEVFFFDPFEDAPTDLDEGVFVVPAGGFITEREWVQKWAITAGTSERLRELEALETKPE